MKPFKAIKLSITQLNLKAVLKCGQSFRWTVIPLDPDDRSITMTSETPTSSSQTKPLIPTEEWRLTLADRVICLRQTDDTLYYRAHVPSGSALDLASEAEDSTRAWLWDYFQLDIDLESLYSQWSEMDHVFKRVAPRFPGIRILRQDPWENLVSFICSQNNHISRITSMVHSLCIHFSPPLCPGSELSNPPLDAAWHAFPPPSVLVNPDVEAKLRDLGFGYRAKYIQKTAAMLCEKHEEPLGSLLALRKLPTSEAREKLLELHGVGPKVADCILLMSLDKAEVVPVDTHVQQIATKMYGFKSRAGQSKSMNPKLYSEIATKFTDTWGPYAGWAHSVLFTADLKSFANFGLDANAETTANDATLPLPSPAPGPNVNPLDEGKSAGNSPKSRVTKKRKSDAAGAASSVHQTPPVTKVDPEDPKSEPEEISTFTGRSKRLRKQVNYRE
ncbi:N-glycosylase/DNA lyase [Ceratobasidium sp. AG-Ba]|nr:N-glycosylase/DNA lyase [Ceratobasidium sp. AG-Ba]QRW15265.1 N-glycosylase/DNA lyase [Ceratobasidium sp. AG-Ba]